MISLMNWVILIGVFGLGRSEIDRKLENLYKEEVFDDNNLVFGLNFDGLPGGDITLFQVCSKLRFFKFDRDQGQGYSVHSNILFEDSRIFSALRMKLSDHTFVKTLMALGDTVIQYFNLDLSQDFDVTIAFDLQIRFVNPVVTNRQTGQRTLEWSRFVCYFGIRGGDNETLTSPSVVNPIHIVGKPQIYHYFIAAASLSQLDLELIEATRESLEFWNSMIAQQRPYLYHDALLVRTPIMANCDLSNLHKLVEKLAPFDWCFHFPVHEINKVAEEILKLGFYPLGTEVIFRTIEYNIETVQKSEVWGRRFYTRCEVHGVWAEALDISGQPELETQCRNKVARDSEYTSELVCHSVSIT